MANSKAIPLIMEFMGHQDLDDNGMIYGYDFRISGVFPSKPKMLASLDTDPDFLSLSPAITISWEDFLNMSADTARAIVLSIEFNNGIDVEGNGGIYGTDFKCTAGPDILTQLEDDPSWVEPPISLTWAEYLQNVTSSYYGAVLRQECITATDLDGNGLIYGALAGFKIEIGDPFKTQFLIDLEATGYWLNPVDEKWWPEYLNTL